MDFRKKLLVLSASAMAFAGVAFAGEPPPPPPAVPANPVCSGATVASLEQPNLLRVEGYNDLLSDLQVTCLGTATITSGTVVVSLTNGQITSKQISKALNEATLLVTPSTTTTPTTYSGVIGTGSANGSVSFSKVIFPDTAYTMTVVNIRVNSSALPINQYVTESLNVFNKGEVEFSTANPNNIAPGTPQGPTSVGLVLSGFTLPSVALNPFSGFPGLASYPICVGNFATNSFTLDLSSNFVGAFKVQVPTVNTVTGGALSCALATCTETNGEQGSYQNVGINKAVGTATSGTRFILTFAGVPTAATVYLPTSIGTTTALPEGSSAVLTLTTGGPTSPFTAATPTAAGPFAGLTAITLTNGGGTAVYEITATDNTVQSEGFAITGIISVPANFSSTAPAAPTVAFAPAPTGVTTNVPDFVSAGTTLTLNGFSLCQTSLLFPFVTNQLGFNTGIVLANTTQDPWGPFNPFAVPAQVPPIGTGATPTTGGCVLSFFGSGGPATQPVAAPGGPQAPGTVNAFTLDTVAPGFQGYMIAQCQFLFGHGYAFLEDGLGTNSAIAEGYVALVITDRGGGGALNESLGQ